MKRVLFVALLMILWYLFVNSSEPMDKYIVIYQDENVTIKTERGEYLKLLEKEKEVTRNRDIKNWLDWEFGDKFKNRVS